MAEDEDVVFHNSPLYRHLSEVGFTDFDVQTLSKSHENAHLIPESNLRQKNVENIGNRNLKERAMILAKRYIFKYFLDSTVSKEISCYRSCVAMIQSSKLLAEDDLELLCRFEQCKDITFETDSSVLGERRIGESSSESSKENNSFLCNLATNRFFIGVTILSAIILGFLLNTQSSNLKIIFHISLTTVTICLLLRIYFLHKIKNRIYILKKKEALIFEYIHFTDQLLVLIRKAILLIQEKELVARGHIIVNPGAPVMRLESQIKQCTILRKCLLVEIKNYLQLLGSRIKDISNLSFLCSDYGNLRWLKNMIENELIAEIGENLQSTDYSLKTLKNAFSTLRSQQSLLLCCTAVNLMLAIISLKQSEENQIDSHEVCCLVADLLDGGKKCFDTISQVYKFHKVNIPALDGNQKHSPFRETPYSSLKMALRSMTLHLQQACRTSIEIEEKADRLTAESTEDPLCTDLDEISKQILLLGQAIVKVNVCSEESQRRLEEITLNSSKKETSGNIVEQKPNVDSFEREERDVQVINLGEKAEQVRDQIFEGETKSEYGDEEQHSANLGREELFKEEKLREESRRLLKELKSVLATKDEEKMVGIPKVLLLKNLRSDESDASVGNTVDSKGDAASGKVSSCATDLLSHAEVEDGSSLNETSHADLPDKEHVINNDAIHVVTNPAKNPQKLLTDPGTDNVVYYPLDNINVTTDQSFIENMSHANPFASIVAAAAAARNRQFGVVEQSYEIETETFSDESDTNT